MRRLIAIVILVLLFAGMASAMRWNIGASQVSRIDIGAAQESAAAAGGDETMTKLRRHLLQDGRRRRQ